MTTLNLIKKAAQAIKKNHSLFVTTGSGMLAESGVEPLRGTYGLWKQYPVLQKMGQTYEKLNSLETFQNDPHNFWYLFGNLYNKYRDAEPHQGYYDLLEIVKYTKGRDGWFLYHEGIDLLYERAGKIRIF